MISNTMILSTSIKGLHTFYYINPHSVPITRTRKAMNHARVHCIITTVTAHFLPSSRFTAAIAAIQGVYNKEKTRNTNAENDVNIVDRELTCPPSKTVSVLTTLSLAVKPVINAVDALQSPKPRGTKIGDIMVPIIANKLFEESATTFNLVSKFCKNQIIMEATNMTVNAFVIKSLALSPINCITLLGLGIL